MEHNYDEIISKMTLREKIDMIHGVALFKNGGIDRLDIPQLVMSDGPCGVRFDHRDDNWIPINEEECYVSWLPSGTALASTWNPNIAKNVGHVLGKEARGRGKDIILAPGINIHRTPLCGRNFEYMSEDPYLTGIIASSEIIGIQNNDVAACVKHFALNNQEKDRMSVNVIVDDSALYEIYLPAFEAVTTIADSHTIMCSYNKVRDTFASESKLLLTDILRDEWHYEGVIISDWSAVHSTYECAMNGVDIEMGVGTNFNEYFFADKLEEEVKAGKVPIEVIDRRILRILKLIDKLKIGKKDRQKGCYNTPEHHNILLNAAREGIVLLKNEDNVLPFNADKIKKVAVIGDVATRKLAHGGGSSEIKALFEITPLLGLNMLEGSNIDFLYAPGYYVDNATNTNGEVNWQAASLDKITDPEKPDKNILNEIQEHSNKLLNEALELAKTCDAVIFTGGLNRAYDTEGFDRTSYDLPYNQDRVINALLDVNPNTVIYLLSGSAINTSRFADKAKAILWSSMNGMQGGLALAEVIFGVTNPSGKLPVTFAADINDYASHSIGEYPGTKDTDGNPVCHYREGLMIGYRHFITNKVKSVFNFGHGLSYTTFEYSDLSVSAADSLKQPTITDSTVTTEPDNNTFTINFKVKNTGSIAGSEVAMLFISPKSYYGNEQLLKGRPVIELKKFIKTNLNPGEEKEIKLCIDSASFAIYDEAGHSYRAYKGQYDILIGRSVDDLRLCKAVELTTEQNVKSLISGI